MAREKIVQAISNLFVLLFLYTGIMKIIDHRLFHDAMLFSIIGPYANSISWTVPILEIVTTISLLFSRTRKLGLYLSLLLMITFTSYVGYIVFFTNSDDWPCHCGGVIQNMGWVQHLIFNSVFTSLAILGIALDRYHIPKDPHHNTLARINI
jgi:putative oxidoreductase